MATYLGLGSQMNAPVVICADPIRQSKMLVFIIMYGYRRRLRDTYREKRTTYLHEITNNPFQNEVKVHESYHKAAIIDPGANEGITGLTSWRA